MYDTIRFLEFMGAQAEVRHATKVSLRHALDAQRIEPEAQWATLQSDASSLQVWLGSRNTMACFLAAEEGDLIEAVEEVAEEAVA